MSLMQRVELASVKLGYTEEPVETVASQHSDAKPSNIRSIRALDTDVKENSAAESDPRKIGLHGRPESASVDRASNRKGQSMALDLIDEVSAFLPELMDRNDKLQRSIEELKQKHEAEMESATLLVCEWRRSAEMAKLKSDHLEKRLQETTERMERAEANLASQTELTVQAGREAAEAECLSSLFEDKVLRSFGAGSLFQEALEKARSNSPA